MKNNEIEKNETKKLLQEDSLKNEIIKKCILLSWGEKVITLYFNIKKNDTIKDLKNYIINKIKKMLLYPTMIGHSAYFNEKKVFKMFNVKNINEITNKKIKIVIFNKDGKHNYKSTTLIVNLQKDLIICATIV